MENSKNLKSLFKDLSSLNGIGKKTSDLLRKKNINKIFDLLWRAPKSFIDGTHKSKINELIIGEYTTINVNVKKYNFPRIRNLPSKVICEDETGTIDCVFFNSREGYIRKILPINTNVTISGKIGYFNKKYQITNPTYISNNKDLIEKVHSKYELTDGISQKVYNKIINQALMLLPDLPEWHNKRISQKFNHISPCLSRRCNCCTPLFSFRFYPCKIRRINHDGNSNKRSQKYLCS